MPNSPSPNPPSSRPIADSNSPVDLAGEDRLRAFVDGVTDYAIFMLDVDGRVASWNSGAERIKGYSPAEIIGQHFSCFYPAEVVADGLCEHALYTAQSTGRFEDEGWRIRKDGSRFWANVVITAVQDADGRLVGFGKVTRDLTERRAAEERVRQSEERLRLLIASVTDYAIFGLDSSGHVASWNPGAERLKGYVADEIIGRHFSAFYPRDAVDAGVCETELAEAERVGRFEDEGWRVRKDGTTFWANVILSPIRDDEGRLAGFAKVTRDLSERRRHEEERVLTARSEEARRVAEENEANLRNLAERLRQARDKAEEATRLKDEFLSTVSHELRTPLHVILGWARLLRNGTLDPSKAKRAIETIVRSGEIQAQIVEDLLDVSRIVAGQLRVASDPVDIEKVARAAIEVASPAANAKGVEVDVEIEAQSNVLRGDAHRLQQVFWNLLANAVKFTDRGGRVRFGIYHDEAHVRVEVTDTGHGIAPEFLEHVFERFSQEDATRTRRSGGLGLGLAVVKHLVELHGGTVEARSAGIGCGSTFVVRIPLVAEAPRRPTEFDDAPLGSSHAYDLRSLRVLVLDDERDARELIESILEREGVAVRLAENVPEAIAMVRNDPPDVVVSDIGMPDEDGYSFVRRLRELPAERGGRVPAVALTAFARSEDRRKALLAGFQNHVAKPVDPLELTMILASVSGRFS